MQNELDLIKRMKFEAKTQLLRDLTLAIERLNSSTKFIINALKEGLSYDEFLVLFIGFDCDLKNLHKYLDVKMNAAMEESKIKKEFLIKTLDKDFVYSIHLDIKEIIEISSLDNDEKEKKDLSDKVIKMFNKVMKVTEEYQKIFSEYKKEVVELGYTNQETIDEINKKHNVKKDVKK